MVFFSDLYGSCYFLLYVTIASTVLLSRQIYFLGPHIATPRPCTWSSCLTFQDLMDFSTSIDLGP